MAGMSLIRFRGHLPKGGYDGTHGIKQSWPPVHIAHDRVVQRLQQAEEALVYAAGIDQVRLVMDVAAAQEVFATRQRMGEAVIGQAHALKTRALVKLGELLESLPKAKGGEHGGKSRIDGSRVEPSNPTLSYADLGVTKKLASVAQQLAALPAATREAIAQREVTLSQARREVKAKEVTKRVSLPDAKYRVLYADPPWSYNDKADGIANLDRYRRWRASKRSRMRQLPKELASRVAAGSAASCCATDASFLVTPSSA